MMDLVIVGFGGHAKSVADTIERTGQFNIVGYTDVKEDMACSRYKYLGTDDILMNIFDSGVKCATVSVGYIGKSDTRDKLYKMLKDIGFELPVVVDPSAIVSETAAIGEGTFIGKGAIVNAEAKVGMLCIINSKALVEHETVVGDYSHVAVGANLCEQVRLGDHVFVGAGATVAQCVNVGAGSFIKAGEVYSG